MQGEFFEKEQEGFININLNDIHPIFKIKKSSSEEDFKKQYKKLILKHHPDKGGDSSMFIKIKEAWDNLFYCSICF
jgi:DnaJ-class molecular chaperone